jgi:glycosyltransferase involved in cell wall biosynthesis
MNILYINHYAGSLEHGMEFRSYYLAREWIKSGHKVKILAASYSHVRTLQPRVLSKILNENIDGIDFSWYKTSKYSGNGLGRALNIFQFIYSIWKNRKEIKDNFSPDVVIASSTYPMDIWPAKKIADLYNAKLIYEMHDLWPISPIELGNMSKWHPFIMLVQSAEDYAYKYADAVVSLLPKAKQYMISRGLSDYKFNYIPNGVDTSEWVETRDLSEPTKTQIENIKKRGLPIVGYAGSHGIANALDMLLNVAKLGYGEFEVVMVGNGLERNKLFQRIQAENIKNVTMLPAIAKAEIPALLKYFDVAYIGWKLNSLYRFGISPNKLIDYMMAGRPILHAVCAGNDPVLESNCGITVRPDDENDIHTGLINILKMTSEQRVLMGENGRHYILSNRTYPVLAKSFVDVMKGIQNVNTK